jgi:hypothetical protein
MTYLFRFQNIMDHAKFKEHISFEQFGTYISHNSIFGEFMHRYSKNVSPTFINECRNIIPTIQITTKHPKKNKTIYTKH